MMTLNIPNEQTDKINYLKRRQGLKLKLARLACEMTQQELADQLKIGRRTLCAYEKGINAIDSILIFEFAIALHQDISYFSPFD